MGARNAPAAATLRFSALRALRGGRESDPAAASRPTDEPLPKEKQPDPPRLCRQWRQPVLVPAGGIGGGVPARSGSDSVRGRRRVSSPWTGRYRARPSAGETGAEYRAGDGSGDNRRGYARTPAAACDRRGRWTGSWGECDDSTGHSTGAEDADICGSGDDSRGDGRHGADQRLLRRARPLDGDEFGQPMHCAEPARRRFQRGPVQCARRSSAWPKSAISIDVFFWPGAVMQEREYQLQLAFSAGDVKLPAKADHRRLRAGVGPGHGAVAEAPGFEIAGGRAWSASRCSRLASRSTEIDWVIDALTACSGFLPKE